jgi:hypothetical protein
LSWYNASAVKNYSATRSLARFENENIFMHFDFNAGVLVVNSDGVGLAPGLSLLLLLHAGS